MLKADRMESCRYSILVADDDQAIIRTTTADIAHLAHQLKLDVQIYSATSGSDALTIIDENPIDVLFLDYKFEGGMNGDEVIENIDDPFGDILIVLMSAWEQKELERVIFKRHRKLGDRFKFLRKPFEFLELQARFLEATHFSINRPYPLPLAHSMRVMESRSTAQGRLSAMKDVVEAVLRFTTVILASNLLRTKLNQKLELGINWQLSLTMGAWIKALNRLLEQFATDKSALFVPELYDLFFNESGKPADIFSWLYEFKDDLRDPVIGHGLTLDEGAYRLLASKYEVSVESLYKKCRFLAKYHLTAVEKVNFSTHTSDVIDYILRDMMGPETLFKFVNWNSNSRLPIGTVCLHRWDQDVLPLYPLLLLKTCHTCMSERLYILNNVKVNALEYSALCNHKLIDSETKEMFDMLFQPSKLAG